MHNSLAGGSGDESSELDASLRGMGQAVELIEHAVAAMHDTAVILLDLFVEAVQGLLSSHSK